MLHSILEVLQKQYIKIIAICKNANFNYKNVSQYEHTLFCRGTTEWHMQIPINIYWYAAIQDILNFNTWTSSFSQASAGIDQWSCLCVMKNILCH